MKIYPFQPLVPASNTVASCVTCPPCDSLSVQDAALLFSNNPASFLPVIRPDAALTATAHGSFIPTHNDLCVQAASSLSTLVSSNVLVPEPAPALYIYQMQSSSILHRGLVAAVPVHDYAHARIKPHELTRPEKELLCANLTKALSANTSPVFLTYRSVSCIDVIITDIAQTTLPLFSVKNPPSDQTLSPDSVTHSVYRVPPALVDAFLQHFDDHVPCVYIADGHHRAATAAKLAAASGTVMSAQLPAFIFPHTQVSISSFHRLVRAPSATQSSHILPAISQIAKISLLNESPVEDFPPPRGHVYMYIDKCWYDVELPPINRNGIVTQKNVVDTLDPARLQREILSPIFCIDDPRTDPRLTFVPGLGNEASPTALKTKVDLSEADAAFILRPVSISDVMRVADAGDTMPPKSTCFEPKPWCGFFVHQV